MAGSEGAPRAVESLLSDRSSGFGLTFTEPVAIDPGTVIGGATVIRLLGEGGMGRVYEARQAAPDRLVAVKVLRDAFISPEQLRRFAYEAEVLGRLRHPNIAQVFTAGVHEVGPLTVPFFMMELVPDARPITLHAADRGLGIRERVDLFRRVCDAVAHGHRKGVIHRDLKPANILVDAAGEPKVIDFGVARSLEPDQGHAPPRTLAGQRVGTLLYMSPEQLDGRVDEIDARTDVYALGLVLHELVAERLPTEARGASWLAAARTIDDVGPQAARAVERAARAHGCGRCAARSLGAIVATCLAANPAARYETAGEVAAELGRFVRDEPVLARPPTWGESIGRFTRRHRAATLATAVATLSLVSAFIGISMFSLAAARRAAEARAELYHATVLLAAEARDRESVADARHRLAAAAALAADAGGPQPCELACIAASLDDAIAVMPEHTSDVLAAAWSPDGSRLATGGRDGRVRVEAVPVADAAGGEPVEFVGHDAAVWRIAWSPDGLTLATASADATARLWDAATGREVRTIRAHEKPLYGVAFSRDGRMLATSGADRTARLWDAATGAELHVLSGHEKTVHSVEFSPDGGTVVTASQDGTVRLWDAEQGAPLRTLPAHDGWVYQATLTPDGARLATASKDATAKLWDVASGACLATFRHPLRVNAVAFTADGGHLATASHDAVLRVFATASGREVRRLRGHEAALWIAACSPKGQTIATGSGDRTVRLWEADGESDPVVHAAAAVGAIAWAGDGAIVAVGDEASNVTAYDAATLRVRSRVRVAAGAIADLAVFPGGARLAAACHDGTVHILDLGQQRDALRIPCHEKAVTSVAVSPDGRRLATVAENGQMKVRDLASWEVATQERRLARRAHAVRFSPDGRLVYAACDEHHASAWDATTGELVRRFVGHEGAVTWLAVSADGTLLATASIDGTVGIWRAGDGRLVHRLPASGCEVSRVAFTPDGMRVAAVSSDGATHLWDATSGRPLPILRGFADHARALAFAPDGAVLAIGGADMTVHFEGRAAADVFRRRLEAAISPQRR